MKILVTGSSGFVGTHLCSSLRKNHEVVTYDLVDGEDIFNSKLLNKKTEGADVVIHLAAFISANESWEKEEEYYRNNALGTLKVFESAKLNGVKKLVFFSSAAVKARPFTPYAISKQTAENILNLHKTEMEIIIVRPENIYGPGQKANYGYVIHNFINAALNSANLSVYGNGRQSRDFIYINDVVAVTEKLATGNIKAKDPISLGTGVKTEIYELAKMVKKITGSNSKIIYSPKRVEPAKSIAELSTLKSLGFETNKFTGLKTGISDLIKLHNSK